MIHFWKRKKSEPLVRRYREDGREEFLSRDQFIEQMIEEQKEKARKYQNQFHREHRQDAMTDFFMSRWHL